MADPFFTPLTKEEKRSFESGEKEKFFTPLEKDEKIDYAFQEEEEPTEMMFQPLTVEAGETQFSQMSKFHKVLDVIGRPGQFIKGFVSETQDQNKVIIESIRPGDDSPEAHQERMIAMGRAGTTPDMLRKRVERGWAGFTRQEVFDANKMWEKVGVKGVPLLGFATEIAADPLMYGGYDAITKGITKTLVGTGRVAMKVPGVAPAVGAVRAAVGPPFRRLAERFTTKSGIKKLDELVTKWLSKRQYIKGREIRYAKQTRDAIQSISKKTGQSVDDVQRRVVNLVELRNYPDEIRLAVPNATVEERVLANTLKSHWDNMLAEEIKTGVPIVGLSGVRTEKIAKLRKNLNVVREARATELAAGRKQAVRELDIISEMRMRAQMRGLRDKKLYLKDKVFKENSGKIRELDKAVDSVEKQMKLLESHRVSLVKMGKPVARLDRQLDKLENQYWYLHSEIGERLTTIPEAAKGSKLVQSLAEVDDILRNDIQVNLGRPGVRLGEKIAMTAREEGKLLATEIGVPRGKGKSLLKQLTVQRGKRDFGYFPRITTKEAETYLRQATIGHTKVWNTRMKSALARRTDDFTLEEFNMFVEGLGLKSLGGKNVEQFFMAHPAYAVAARGAQSAKAITSASFLDEVGKTFGVGIKVAPEFYVELPQRVLRLNPGLKGKWFDPEVAAELSKVSHRYLDPRQARFFIPMWDKVQNMWKRWTLAPFPKFHMRNMAGNIWNNYLAGVVNPKHYLRAQALQTYRKYGRSGSMGRFARAELKKLGISELEAINWIDDMEKLGVVGRGWFAADIELGTKQLMQKGGGVIKWGTATGTTIENNARIAHYLAKLEKGDDALKASLSVKKYLFDYQDLTAFERDVLKRLFPFYTWTRKNIPLQIEHLWKQPSKFIPVAKLLQKGDTQDLLRLKHVRPDVYERLPIEMRRDIDSVTYVPLEGLLPAGDLAKLVRPQSIFLDLLTPFLRAPMEMAFNKNLFFGNEIQRYPSQTQEFLRADVPVALKYFFVSVLPQGRMLREIDKLVRKKRKGEDLTGPELAFQHTLSSVFKISLEDLRRRALSRVMEGVRELEKGAVWAKKNDRPKELERIKAEIRKVRDELRRLK